MYQAAGILSTIFKNLKNKASNIINPVTAPVNQGHTPGDQLGSATGAVGSTGDLNQIYSSGNDDIGGDTDSHGGLDSSSDSYSEDSGTDTGSTDVGGWTNQGGYVNQGGFPGEPRGTDNVPTWLTPGEFVVDRDSAQKYGPLLEKINAEEPTMGTEEGVMSQLDDLINRHSGV